MRAQQVVASRQEGGYKKGYQTQTGQGVCGGQSPADFCLKEGPDVASSGMGDLQKTLDKLSPREGLSSPKRPGGGNSSLLKKGGVRSLCWEGKGGEQEGWGDEVATGPLLWAQGRPASVREGGREAGAFPPPAGGLR